MREEPKRYSLALPKELFDQVQQVADDKQTSVAELLKKFIRLGLIAMTVEGHPQSELIIREGKKERQIILL